VRDPRLRCGPHELAAHPVGPVGPAIGAPDGRVAQQPRLALRHDGERDDEPDPRRLEQGIQGVDPPRALGIAGGHGRVAQLDDLADRTGLHEGGVQPVVERERGADRSAGGQRGQDHQCCARATAHRHHDAASPSVLSTAGRIGTVPSATTVGSSQEKNPSKLSARQVCAAICTVTSVGGGTEPSCSKRKTIS